MPLLITFPQSSILLFPGSQKNCDGPVSIEKVEAIRKQVQSRSDPSIYFNPHFIKNKLTGGTCGAMTFDFINRYLQQENSFFSNQYPFYKTYLDSKQMKCLYFKELQEMGRIFSSSSEERRTIQSVFRTASGVDIYPYKSESWEKQKMRTLQSKANYYNLQISSVKRMDIKEIRNPKELEPYMKEGTFIILLENYDKKSSHSLAYNHQEKSFDLLYDPNLGAVIFQKDNAIASLYSHFQQYYTTIGFNSIIFASVKLTKNSAWTPSKIALQKHLIDHNFINPYRRDRVMLFSGSQINYNGKASTDVAQALRCRLRKKQEEGIFFDNTGLGASNLNSPILCEISGGTCSAMAFQFADVYLSLKKNLLDKSNSKKNLSHQQHILLLEKLQQSKKIFSSSSHIFRTLQVAYNSIDTDSFALALNPTINLKKNKIQSLVNSYGWKIDSSPSEFNMGGRGEELQDSFAEYMKSLSKGIFIGRILKLCPNTGTEEYGHTIIYIQEGPFRIFYDPNVGAIMLSKRIAVEFLLDAFKKMHEEFSVSNLNFYRIQSD